MSLAATPTADAASVLRDALGHARHLVPAQSPLDRFVHHNPLHAFEGERFEDAVVSASRVYGTEPFWPESAYREAYQQGRVRQADLRWAVEREVDAGPVAGIVGRRDLTVAVLLHPIEPLSGEGLEWALSETDALRAPRSDLSVDARSTLLAEAGGDAARAVLPLWDAACLLASGLSAPSTPGTVPVRVRDELVARGHADPDRLVNPMLVRWCGAYLDHGVAYWPMAGRDQGFLAAFLSHLDQPIDLGRGWLRTAREVAARARREGWSSEALSLHLLERLGHPVGAWHDVVLQTLLALRGWAGMFQRLTDRPDTAPSELRLPTELGELLAVRLLLDLSAATHTLGAGAERGPLLPIARAVPATPEATGADPRWTLFQLAQILGIGAHSLDDLGPDRVATLLAEVAALDDTTKRRLWHTAYERRFRVQTLDAVSVHARRAAATDVVAPRVQVACCIDDREESLRRLLEEAAPWVETLGVAGNFGISMYYQGLEHGHPVALGPAGFEPRHLVRERAEGTPFVRKRWTGLARHHLDVGSQTLLRGAMVTLGGALTALPLSLRLLAPKVHAQLTRRDLPTLTDLDYERVDDTPDAHGLWQGFSVDEMVDIVENTLQLMSLLRDFTDLVVCLGHGSRSMNNPHEAAHDCGACGGGRGGPNARLFARMANDPRVREALDGRGIHIPAQTWFVGGYHNTADDAVELYDLERVPPSHASLLAETREALDVARRLDAVERCRKFENVPLDITIAGAMDHVENRDEDLAQPRPEYGHCTNAICFVGRRAWSRGLFLDRRAFLCSYDPEVDDDGALLAQLLAMAVPVGAGINLEYWFSVIDPVRYGCGTKLPHNITGLVGVMDGHSSDLRTGLPWQMVELHEPVRLLCVVEAPPERLLAIAAEHPAVGRLVTGGWVQLACLEPETGQLQYFEDGAFRPWKPDNQSLPRVASSEAWFRGTRGLLPCASVDEQGGAS